MFNFKMEHPPLVKLLLGRQMKDNTPSFKPREVLEKVRPLKAQVPKFGFPIKAISSE
jgi:hypothetical protein